jgi:cobyrinic acid a,c-diamide synthase
MVSGISEDKSSRADSLTRPALMIAAPASNSGKTTITLGLLRALANRGVPVTAAKSGPDYIDPAFQAAASRHSCINLDPWAMPEALIRSLVDRHHPHHQGRAQEDDGLMLCEAAMGLFDGAAGGGGSSADLAGLMGWPVVLVVDVKGQSASAAAVIQGFSRFRTDVKIAGVILNRVGSPRHQAMIVEACAAATPDIPIIGAIRRSADLVLPERHLGLVQAGEHPDLEAFLTRAAGIIAEDVDLDALIALAGYAPPAFEPVVCNATISDPATFLRPIGQRIAIARDAAFAFAYPHMIAAWHMQGAELSFFSPLADQAPSPDCDAVFLPGGYPELHGGTLAAATRFLSGLRDAADRGSAIYGECGGYMALGETLIDSHGTAHAMAGLLPLVTSFADRKLHLGYRRGILAEDCVLGARADIVFGHEFHYARTLRADGPGWLNLQTADGTDLGSTGLHSGSVYGSFFHLICAGHRVTPI